jgi:hypothetical protein
MTKRLASPLLALILCAPWLAACPGAPGGAGSAAPPPVNLTTPGLAAARATFECAVPPDAGALRATGEKHGHQWYAVPPGFTVFGLPVRELGLMSPVSRRSQTIAAVSAPSAAVLAAVKARLPDIRVTHPGPDPHNQADTGYEYLAWGASGSMRLQAEGAETYLICDGDWDTPGAAPN